MKMKLFLFLALATALLLLLSCSVAAYRANSTEYYTNYDLTDGSFMANDTNQSVVYSMGEAPLGAANSTNYRTLLGTSLISVIEFEYGIVIVTPVYAFDIQCPAGDTTCGVIESVSKGMGILVEATTKPIGMLLMALGMVAIIIIVLLSVARVIQVKANPPQ